ncbi:MAG TPA: DUF5666 domain-containing protein, partial [Anaerolineae bacterium]|nr:DUF5666 domain-containing protein [Anaerolineae bacterium]
METRLEEKLIECLSALDQGESIDQVLARYPDDAPQLRRLLLTAQALPSLRLEPSEATKLKSREAFLKQASTLRQSKRRTFGLVPRLATTLAALILLSIVASAGAVAASSAARPGDPLYGLKRTVENARLALSPDDNARKALAAQFDQTRIDEIVSLVGDKRTEAVDFSGTIESIQTSTWTIASVNVTVNSTTDIKGTPALGAHAHVLGETEDNGVVASQIEIQAIGQPPIDNSSIPAVEDTPAPTPTEPRPSATPTPEATQVPEATHVPEPTQKPEATQAPEPTQAPEATHAPEPTQAPDATDVPEATHAPTPTQVPETTHSPQTTQVPEATHPPDPTKAPEPTDSPPSMEVDSSGVVQAIGTQSWTINGLVIQVTAATKIDNGLAIGQYAKVKA